MDKAVLDLLAFYRKELRETQEGREALEKIQIHSPEVVEHFGLGFSSGRALRAASEDQYRLFQNLNLASYRKERFNGCIVVPVYDEDDRLVDLCGLRPYASGLRFITWQEPMRGLIGVHALSAYPEIILTDNPFHALHVRQHGCPNVVGLRNASELKRHLDLFERNAIERVYLVSRQQRKILQPVLERAGVDVTYVSIPVGKTVIPKESLDVVGERPREKVRPAEAKLVARTETRLHFSAGDVTYKVESVAASGLGMRVQVRAERQGVTFIDRLDLASASARRKFARLCASRFDVPSREIEGQLSGVAAAVDSLESEALHEQTQAPQVLSDREREKALAVLSEKDILTYQADALERLFHFTAEPENKRLALLVAASRLLDQPLGAIVRGATGSGKSSLMQAVSRVLPYSEALNLSRLTPQALYFLPKDSLDHKLLICDEYEGLSNSEYALRTIMSSQFLSLAITVRESGRVPITKTIEIPATLAILVSSTQPVNIENLSRFIELRMDPSSEQTKRVMQELAKARAKKVDASRRRDEVKLLQGMSRLLKPCAVEIPFADRLVYASGSVLARRQFAQIVGLVSAHAALFQHQRKSLEDEGGRLVVRAEWDDYAAVYPLLGHIIEHFEEEVSPAAMELLEHIEKRKTRRLTRKDAMEWLGWSYSKAYRVLRELAGLDLLVPDSTTNGVLRTYEAAPYFRNGRGISQIAPPDVA